MAAMNAAIEFDLDGANRVLWAGGAPTSVAMLARDITAATLRALDDDGKLVAISRSLEAPASGTTGTTEEAEPARRDMLTCDLGVETATPIEQVSEILACAPSQPALEGGGALLSVLVSRGRSIPVMCLARLATGQPLETTDGANVLVVDSDGELVGFVVPGLKAIEEARWQPALPAGAAGRARPWRWGAKARPNACCPCSISGRWPVRSETWAAETKAGRARTERAAPAPGRSTGLSAGSIKRKDQS